MLNKTSMKFLAGFVAIIFISLAIIVVASFSENVNQEAAVIESL